MAITNSFTGFAVASTTDYKNSDNDSDFGINLNRSIGKVNTDYVIASGILNSYAESNSNTFGASSSFSTNEQRMVQNMIRESININGITVRYMPRWSPYHDHVWNERPESRFHSGIDMDVILVATAGFEGEGDVMTQYGMEFREEVILNVAIPRFEQLYHTFDSDLRSVYDSENADAFARTRPLEGDLIAIPFGRSAQNKAQYIPKIFEITRVTTFHDGAFFQLGDNYQYKLRCKLFELSGEDLDFNPTVVNTETGSKLVSAETGPIARAKTSTAYLDEITRTINIADDSDIHFDSWADNRHIEVAAQTREHFDSANNTTKNKSLVKDYSAEAFGVPGVINNLDNI